MKKIVNFVFLIVVCLLPVMVEAKAIFTYEWKTENNYFLGSVDGKYLFSEEKYVDGNDNKYDVYDKEGNFVETKQFDVSGITRPSDFYDNELNKLYLRNVDDGEFKFNEQLNKFYAVDAYEGEVYIYGEKFTDPIENLSFFNPEDNDTIKEILGKEYDVLKSIYDADLEIDGYTYDDGFYVVWCFNDDYDYYKVFDKDGKLIYNVEFLYEEHIVVHVYDGKIYEIADTTKINIYDLEGELLETFDISSDLNNLYSDIDFVLNNFYIKDNNLMIQYMEDNLVEPNGVGDNPKGMNSVQVNEYSDSRDLVSTDIMEGLIVNLKYKMTNDMILVTSKTGGSYTAERKIDEFDREYVELKITTANGYIVDTIKVIDAKGNEIEVVDNKFYMPSSDVRVEVTYKGGEYLPIPDTGLGRNLTIVLISLILIGLGFYTINYVKREN